MVSRCRKETKSTPQVAAWLANTPTTTETVPAMCAANTPENTATITTPHEGILLKLVAPHTEPVKPPQALSKKFNTLQHKGWGQTVAWTSDTRRLTRVDSQEAIRYNKIKEFAARTRHVCKHLMQPPSRPPTQKETLQWPHKWACHWCGTIPSPMQL